ncbi:MAG TPA: glycosyltransferase, partial [Patescibacteria group bacterium]|nr:glycosyltransferase [Patescibacteria group bacterium]
LEDRKWQIVKHPRKIQPSFRYGVLKHIQENPEYSIRRIVRELRKEFPSLGRHGVLNILKEFNLLTPENRQEFATYKRKLKKGTLHPQERFLLLESVRIEGFSVQKACGLFRTSRKTFYKWYKTYEKERSWTALSDREWKIADHPRRITSDLEQQILTLVVSYPELSKHKIAALMPETSDGKKRVGNHGVYNVLRRFDLTTFEKRYAYAQTRRVPEVVLPIPTGAVVPVPIPEIPQAPIHGPPLSRFITFLRYAFSSRERFLISVFSFGSIGILLYSYLMMLTQAEPGTHLGLIFASIALFFGLFFFLYSIKYYLVIASVLGYSKEFPVQKENQKSGLLQRVASTLGFQTHAAKDEGVERVGLIADIQKQELSYYPFVSIHVATYNEKRVVNRLLTACTSQDYPNYEVVIADDSTDETVDILEQWKSHPRVKISHRPTREGFKGGALGYALEKTDPNAEFVIIFDADFIPYPDTISQFLKYFKASTGKLEKFQDYYDSHVAAIQGYQWHVLNKSENWVTRGVRSEFAGSYVMERSGNEIFGGLKMIAGSVYMIRRDVLQAFGWGTSITEDFELTLKIYEAGYKVVYTPYIQAPSECVSTLKRLIRQRMRWAEGHSFNVKKMFTRLLRTPHMNVPEKAEFLYLSPYYLQSFFFIIGTLAWFLSEAVFHTKLPFWTALWGWSLVFSNMLSLPLMNSVGLFLEEAEEKDFLGLISFVGMSYLLVPFQAYASIRGLLEEEEGGWFRTPKSGKITDTISRGTFYRWLRGLLPRRREITSISQVEVVQPVPNLYTSLRTAQNSFQSFSLQKKVLPFVNPFNVVLAGLVVLLSWSIFTS